MRQFRNVGNGWTLDNKESLLILLMIIDLYIHEYEFLSFRDIIWNLYECNYIRPGICFKMVWAEGSGWEQNWNKTSHALIIIEAGWWVLWGFLLHVLRIFHNKSFKKEKLWPRFPGTVLGEWIFSCHPLDRSSWVRLMKWAGGRCGHKRGWEKGLRELEWPWPC